MKNRNFTVAVVCAIFAGMLFSGSLQAQQTAKLDRQYAQDMLKTISNDVRKHYYDPKFHGVKFDAAVEDAKARIDKSPSLNYSMSIIANMLDGFNDSHLFFIPPDHAYRLDYGWQDEMVGDHCYVLRVRPGTDAATKVKPGDEILAINGIQPTRDDLWKLDYLFRILRPQTDFHLVVRSLDGSMRNVDVKPKMDKKPMITDLTEQNQLMNLFHLYDNNEDLYKARTKELGDDLMVLKIPEFEFTSDEVDKMKGKALKHKALIIDLRENEGGSVDTLEYLIGSLFDKEIKVADRVGRKDMKPQIAKPRDPFTGKLIVLVDSQSASASELFARVIQLQKRGIVIGDRSSGSVMEAIGYDYQIGSDVVIPYGMSITDANLIMTDGKSLEHVGVIPDEVMVPTAADLAAGRDPVLAHAAQELGVKLSPEDAGKMFPYLWPRY